eukprot:14667521-Alexandrium_andersonii.AAC.1
MRVVNGDATEEVVVVPEDGVAEDRLGMRKGVVGLARVPFWVLVRVQRPRLRTEGPLDLVRVRGWLQAKDL